MDFSGYEEIECCKSRGILKEAIWIENGAKNKPDQYSIRVGDIQGY